MFEQPRMVALCLVVVSTVHEVACPQISMLISTLQHFAAKTTTSKQCTYMSGTLQVGFEREAVTSAARFCAVLNASSRSDTPYKFSIFVQNGAPETERER